MYYQIEKYLIEEYIKKIEKQHTQNTENKSNIIEASDDTKMDSILEDKLDILEKKLDYIISTLHKNIK
jgi:hypothetical protein